MPLIFVLKGFVIGFVMSLPIGPVAILCIRQSLTKHPLCGFFAGLGAATADVFYGLIVGFGLTFLSRFLLIHKLWLQIPAIIFLSILGVKIFLSHPSLDLPVKIKKRGLFSSFLSAFVLASLNPIVILFLTAVFTGIGLTSKKINDISIILVIIGLFFGASFWWLILSSKIAPYFRKTKFDLLKLANKTSGAVLLAFAVIFIIKLF